MIIIYLEKKSPNFSTTINMERELKVGIFQNTRNHTCYRRANPFSPYNIEIDADISAYAVERTYTNFADF
jgi:hypothetical protein